MVQGRALQHLFIDLFEGFFAALEHFHLHVDQEAVAFASSALLVLLAEFRFISAPVFERLVRDANLFADIGDHAIVTVDLVEHIDFRFQCVASTWSILVLFHTASTLFHTAPTFYLHAAGGRKWARRVACVRVGLSGTAEAGARPVGRLETLITRRPAVGGSGCVARPRMGISIDPVSA